MSRVIVADTCDENYHSLFIVSILNAYEFRDKFIFLLLETMYVPI